MLITEGGKTQYSNEGYIMITERRHLRDCAEQRAVGVCKQECQRPGGGVVWRNGVGAAGSHGGHARGAVDAAVYRGVSQQGVSVPADAGDSRWPDCDALGK